MSVIRITEKGWENYTGHLGGLKFVNSVSVQKHTAIDFGRINATLSVELDESQPDPDELSASAQISQISPPLVPELEAPAESAPQPEVTHVPTNRWTAEVLEAIADKEGITGLRAIADGYNVKSKSISDLITGILDAQ